MVMNIDKDFNKLKQLAKKIKKIDKTVFDSEAKSLIEKAHNACKKYSDSCKKIRAAVKKVEKSTECQLKGIGFVEECDKISVRKWLADSKCPMCNRHFKIHCNIMALNNRGMGEEVMMFGEKHLEKLISYSNKTLKTIGKKLQNLSEKQQRAIGKSGIYLKDIMRLSEKELTAIADHIINPKPKNKKRK
jgi:hypothetical protein